MSELEKVLVHPAVFKAMFNSELRTDLIRLWSTVIEYKSRAELKRMELRTSSMKKSAPKNLEQVKKEQSLLIDNFYREALKEFDEEDPREEAMVFSLLGDFFLLDKQDAQGMILVRPLIQRKEREKPKGEMRNYWSIIGPRQFGRCPGLQQAHVLLWI